MSKNKFQGHAPRPTKGELVNAARQQTKVDHEKARDSVVGPSPKDAPKAANPDVVETQQQEKVGELSGPVLALVKEMGKEESKAEEPAKPAPKTEPSLYRIGKKYAPKTDRNTATWNKLVKALAEGPRTLKELTEEIKDHKDFLGYMTRGGHIVPYVAEEATK